MPSRQVRYYGGNRLISRSRITPNQSSDTYFLNTLIEHSTHNDKYVGLGGTTGTNRISKLSLSVRMSVNKVPAYKRLLMSTYF
jgi:hypothetical protein